MRTKVTVVSALIGLLTLLPACSNGDDSPAPLRTPSLDQVPVAHAEMILPFDAYQLPIEDRVRIQQGHATLLSRCMSKSGLNVRFYGDYLRPPGRVPLGTLVGTMTPVQAASKGYQAAPNEPFKFSAGMYQRTVDNIVIDPQLHPELRTSGKFKDAHRGCFDSVEKSINFPVTDIRKEEGEPIELASEHPIVARAMIEWRTCMKRAGRDYKNVIGGFEEFEYDTPDKEQIDVAIADVECTQQSRWADYFYAAVIDYQKQILDRSPEPFEAHLESQRKRLAAVNREVERQ